MRKNSCCGSRSRQRRSAAALVLCCLSKNLGHVARAQTMGSETNRQNELQKICSRLLTTIVCTYQKSSCSASLKIKTEDTRNSRCRIFTMESMENIFQQIGGSDCLQTVGAHISAVSKPISARKHSCCRICREPQKLLTSFVRKEPIRVLKMKKLILVLSYIPLHRFDLNI